MEGVDLTYLLDTGPWVNGVTLPAVFPERIRLLLSSSEIKGVSTLSLLETAILHRLGRIGVRSSLTEFFASALASDIQLIELSPAIAAHTNNLPATFQGDPFDRTIVATAAVLNLTLITSDAQIRDAGACRVEFYPFKPSRRFRS